MSNSRKLEQVKKHFVQNALPVIGFVNALSLIRLEKFNYSGLELNDFIFITLKL